MESVYFRNIGHYNKLCKEFTSNEGHKERVTMDNLPHQATFFKIIISKEGVVKINEGLCSICKQNVDNYMLPCGDTFCKWCVIENKSPEPACRACGESYDLSSLKLGS